MTLPDQPNRVDADCQGNYGGDGLWVFLPGDGTIVFRPGGAGLRDRDGSWVWKFGWCKKVEGPLRITGTRLDGAAAPLRADFDTTRTAPGFVASHLIFPTLGCWKVTASAGDRSLTFVIRVMREPTRARPPATSPRH